MKKLIFSGTNDVMRLSTPSARKPHVNTGLAEYRSATRPQKSRNAAKVTAYAVMIHDCCGNETPRSSAIGAVKTKKAE
jgi:hypothetical protein